MNTFRRILSYGKPYSRYWPPYLILSLLSLVFGIINYALLGPLLTVLFDNGGVAAERTLPDFELSVDYFSALFGYALSSVALHRGMVWALVFVCSAIVVSCFVCDLCRYLSGRILVNMKTRLMKNIRADLFRKMSGLDIGYFSDRRKGDLLSSISNDVNEVQNSVAGSFHIVLREPLLVLGFLAMLFYMSPRLTAVSLVALPVCAVFVTRLTRRMRSGSKEAQDLMGMIVSHFEEAVGGLRVIRAFGAGEYVASRFEKVNERHRKVIRKVSNRQEMASPTSEFLGITIAAVVLFYGGWLNIHGQLGMGWQQFIVYIMFYWKVLEPAKAIANSYAGIQKGLASGERIFLILDARPEITDGPQSIKSFDKELRFNDVCFSYGSGPVLEHVSFSVPKGKTVAIVGPSGAGKSTIADLIPRFRDVCSGSVTLDGVDIRQFRIPDLVSLIGTVGQETILFNDTIFANIAFGMEGVTEEQVRAAARTANADEFISRLPEGYRTNIGDRGLKLSGGQRQRIAIARAVLKNPPILVLDEATSSLDTQSEHLVQEALSELMRNRTCVVVAHRLSTIRYADNIIVLRDGRIEEEGNHEFLVAKDGLYSHLCKLQGFE